MNSLKKKNKKWINGLVKTKKSQVIKDLCMMFKKILNHMKKMNGMKTLKKILFEKEKLFLKIAFKIFFLKFYLHLKIFLFMNNYFIYLFFS